MPAVSVVKRNGKKRHPPAVQNVDPAARRADPEQPPQKPIFPLDMSRLAQMKEFGKLVKEYTGMSEGEKRNVRKLTGAVFPGAYDAVVEY